MTGDFAEFNLAEVDLFSGLSGKALNDLEGVCQYRKYSSGERIMAQGDEDDTVFFLLSGLAHVLNYTDSGRIVNFASISKKSCFGELAAIDGFPRSATVTAATDCDVGLIPGKVFNQVLQTYPDMNRTVLKKLTAIIRAGNERIHDLSLLNGKQRICMQLLRMASKDSPQEQFLVIDPIPTHESLAQTLGLTRETIVRTFRKLKNDGIISRRSRQIFIHNPAKLEEMALP